MTVLGLRKIPFYISCPYWHCCLYAYVYIILTPHEYYIVLPTLAINADSNQGLPHQLCTLYLLSNSIIYISVQYTLLRCAIMTVLSLKKFHFIFQASIVLKSLILLFVHLISLCCPVLFQARPIDSLNRTSYLIGASLSEPHTYHTAVQNPPYIYIYTYARPSGVQFGPAMGPLNAQRADVGPASNDSKVDNIALKTATLVSRFS